MHASQPTIDPLRQALSGARRLVVKVGSAVLAPGAELDPGAVARLAGDLHSVISGGREVVVVSSGAVASGFRPMGLTRKPRTIVEKQAAAAVGQQRLMSAYADAFAAMGRTVAQVLLTADDLDHRLRFLNASRTLEELLRRKVVPIINENDTVSFDEIKLGDNDNLSALVASLIKADLLIILSSVAGLLERGSHKVIPTVAPDEDAMVHVTADKSATGVGGMATKIGAARLAGANGIPTVIAGGTAPGVLGRVLAGEPVGTLFPAAAGGRASRKRWIGYSARVRGTLVVDDGARTAIVQRGASLLPSGVVSVKGDFEIAALVEVRIRTGEPFARGIVSYASDEIDKIRGKKASEIAAVLGYSYSDEVIHRDDLTVTARE